MILATSKHQVPDEKRQSSLDLSFFLDFDLAILGAESDAYARYSKAILHEYERDMDSAQFKAGRALVLRNFLSRPSLYFTNDFQHRFEDQARQNLRNEIESLLLEPSSATINAAAAP